MLNSSEYSERQLSVGQRVSAKGNYNGILRYIGNTNFAEGLWCGIELDEAVGENDGMINCIRYFSCKSNFGLFVPVSEIFVMDNAATVKESFSSNFIKKQLRIETVHQSYDSGFQKNAQNPNALKNVQPVSPDKCQKYALNESYTISNDLHNTTTLSVIPEEVSEQTKLLDWSGTSLFDTTPLNKGKNDVPNNQTFLHHSNSVTGSISMDKIAESSHSHEQTKKESDDSEESLGILPSYVLDNSWEDLMDFENKNKVDFTTALNHDINVNSDEDKFIEDNICDEVFPSDSPLKIHTAEIPVQSDSLPKYASTPKHEINFSDVSLDIENTLNLTHNLSSEFQEHNKKMDNVFRFPVEKIYSVQDHSDMLPNRNIKDLNVTQNFENEAKKPLRNPQFENKVLNVTQDLKSVMEDCLNVTFGKEGFQNSDLLTEVSLESEKKHEIFSNGIQGDLANPKVEEMLNTTCLNVTFEKECSQNSNPLIEFSLESENKHEIFSNGIQRNLAYSKAEEMLNTTYEKEICISDRNTKRRLSSGKSVVTVVNNIKSPKNIKPAKQINKIDFTSNVSFTRDDTKCRLEKSKTRRSVGNISCNTAQKSDAVSKQVRRNSLSSNCTTSSKENLPKSKVSKLSHFRNLSNKNLIKQSCVTSLVTSHGNARSGTTLKKNITSHSLLKCDNSDTKSKIKGIPVVASQNCSKNALNETINFPPPMSEVGKTVVKKPRFSKKFSSQNNASFKDGDIITDEDYESSSARHKVAAVPRALLQNCQKSLNETMDLPSLMNEVGKTVVKKPRCSQNFGSQNNASFEECQVITCEDKSKMTCGKKMPPSKFGRTLKPPEIQYKVATSQNETVLNNRKTKELPFNAVKSDDSKKKIARVGDKQLSSEKGSHMMKRPSFGGNQNGFTRRASFQAPLKPACLNKAAICLSSTPNKMSAIGVPKPDINFSNAKTVSDQSCCRQNEALKPACLNKAVVCHSSTPKISSIGVPKPDINFSNAKTVSDQSCCKQNEGFKNVAKRKIKDQTSGKTMCNLSNARKSLTCYQSSSSKENVEEVPSHRMTLRKRVSMIPRKN